jgi:general secretion pathway protein D
MSARASLVDLIHVFDVDYLAGQSYALFPVKSGDPAKIATDLQHALQLDPEGPLAGAITVVPIEQANAIMVITKDRSYLDRAQRLIAQIDRVADDAGRSLHIYHLKNVQAMDIQAVLQRAINPPSGGAGDTTPAPGNLPPTGEAAQTTTNGISGGFGGGQTPGVGQNAGSPLGIGGASPQGGSQTFGQGAASGSSQTASAPQPDLGQEVQGGSAKGPQIIADTKSNTLVVVATEAEYSKIEAAIRRLDVMPLQVLVEVTVAEVTLNNSLQYGTQFFLHNGSTQATLTNAQSSSPTSVGPTNESLFPGTLAPNYPGFAIARTASSIQFALEALKSVTTVKVVSSPRLLILDHQPDRAVRRDHRRPRGQQRGIPADRRHPDGNAADQRRRLGDARCQSTSKPGGEHDIVHHRFADLPATADPKQDRCPGRRDDQSGRTDLGQ